MEPSVPQARSSPRMLVITVTVEMIMMMEEKEQERRRKKENKSYAGKMVTETYKTSWVTVGIKLWARGRGQK